MSVQVKAISFNQADCGKTVSEYIFVQLSTKKRLEWIFLIGEQQHIFQITNSIISGKKVIKLDNQVIYQQKKYILIDQSVLNLKFDFSHNFLGHSLRVTKMLDALSKFELRIDNIQFDKLYNRQFAQKKQQQSISDPFADFSNIGQNNNSQLQFQTSNKPSNDFGEFDFDSFDLKKPTNQFQTLKQFEDKKQSQIVEEINFLTNANIFQTNCQQTKNQSEDFAARFAKQQSSIINEEVFATNNYVKYAKYKALNDVIGENSDNSQMQKENQGISFDNKKFEENVNQIFNKAKSIAQKAKGKVATLINGPK